MNYNAQHSDSNISNSTTNMQSNRIPDGFPNTHEGQNIIRCPGTNTNILKPSSGSSIISNYFNCSSFQSSQHHGNIVTINHLVTGQDPNYGHTSIGLLPNPNCTMKRKFNEDLEEKSRKKANLVNIIHAPRGGLEFTPTFIQTNLEHLSETFDHYGVDFKGSYVKDPIEAYIKLIPLINKVTQTNYCELLVTVLHECLHQVPLDDFYKLLFNVDENLPDPTLKVHKCGLTQFKKEGLQFFHYIIQTFIPPWTDINPFASGKVCNPLLKRIKSYEFQRAFLAAKILFDSVSQSENSSDFSSFVCRSDVQTSYRLICEKLMSQYPIDTGLPLTKSLVIGQSQLGRILKLKYPNLSSRRLGRRGNSVYHYVGILWNRDLIDEEILNMLNQRSRKPIRNLKFGNLSTKPLGVLMNKPGENVSCAIPSIAVSKPLNFSKYQIHSFVEKTSKYPGQDCSPRSWLFIPGKIPERSNWADSVLLKAAAALKIYEIDVSNLIENFTVNMFSEKFLCTFTEEFVGIMTVLQNQSSPGKAFLHLYLVVLLLIFPIILSDSKEASRDDKSQLQRNLENFVERVNTALQISEVVYPHSLVTLKNLFQKMIRINEFALTHVRSKSALAIVDEFIGDVKRPSDVQLDISDQESANAESCFRAVYVAVNAFECILPEGLKSKSPASIDIITKIAGSFQRCSLIVTKAVLKIRDLITEDDLKQPLYDLPAQLLNALLPVLHGCCLCDPWITQLPIPVINFIILQINKELQNISFKDFGKRNSQLSQETFKTWWVYSSAIEEYMTIYSEISALVGRLFGMTEESK